MSSEKRNLFIIPIFAILLCQFSFSNFSFAQKAKVYSPEDDYKNQQKILKQQAIENYERSLLPESGAMTVEEYENLSKDIKNSDRVIPEYKMPKDIKMKYVPQPTYKLTHYNDPPGSPELHIERSFKFDRQANEGAITSPNKDMLVYPVVYYYANNQCVASDLFVIPLDKTLPDVDRIERANIIKRIPEPILSTDKNVGTKFIFRSMTPIDFSSNGSKLIAKEKIGNINDGIWQTNLWVYDFYTGTARQLPEIREAIKFYWMNQNGLVLDEKRWDINPLGFDATDPQRIVVSAYGYTGKVPKFLGNWSIDCQGERTQLVSLFEPEVKISMNGFKIVQSGVVDPADVYNDEKKQDKIAKQKRKDTDKAKKLDAKQKKEALNKKLKEMKKNESQVINQYNKQQNVSSPTDSN